MKKLLFLLLFVSAIANAQIINFPDANFKAKLLAAAPDVQIAYSQGNFVKIDTDNDGEIEVSEAVVIDSLEVNAAGISNLNGISGFTNLKGLSCQGNFLTSLDMTGQANLLFLRCYSNQISTLNIAGLTNLRELDCSVNSLSTLNINGLPNLKTCLDGNIVSPTKIGDYLHYNINFENTGTAAAENIVVKDMIDMAKFDISTLQIMNASHPVTTKITGNKAEFIFENINLGTSQHGNVVFKIKTKPTLVTGDVVTNKADIFFDYNFPVATNTANTVFQTLGVSQNTFENAISVYPNPTTGMVNLKSVSAIQSVNIFDAQGRVVAIFTVTNTDATIDVSKFTSGIYYLKIITDKGSRIEKLIKN